MENELAELESGRLIHVKYDITTRVYFMHDNQIKCGRIITIHHILNYKSLNSKECKERCNYVVKIVFRSGRFQEKKFEEFELFETKEDLIKHLLDNLW